MVEQKILAVFAGCLPVLWAAIEFFRLAIKQNAVLREFVNVNGIEWQIRRHLRSLYFCSGVFKLSVAYAVLSVPFWVAILVGSLSIIMGVIASICSHLIDLCIIGKVYSCNESCDNVGPNSVREATDHLFALSEELSQQAKK